MTPNTAPGGDIAAQYSDWIGKTLLAEDEISLSAVRRIAAMADLDPATFRRGDALPAHWYSMFFTLNARQSQIGPDGHPRKGEFLPPIALPRRMFVGREVEFLGTLRIGEDAVKRSEIVSIAQKAGRSGPLVFLDVRHTIETSHKPLLIEYQHVVYREAASASTAAVQPEARRAPADPEWRESCLIDHVLLFRYSAVTWNSHRIHYDADYARDQEGYCGCVMNGALTVHLLIDAALRNSPGMRLVGLQARLSKPMFAMDTMTLNGKTLESTSAGKRIQAWAADPQGNLAATVTLDLE